MRALIKEPNGHWRETTVDNTLKALQTTVGGFIECVRLAPDMTLICNEMGRIDGLPFNTRLMGLELHGTVLIVGTHNDQFTDVPVLLSDWLHYWVGGGR